MVNDLNKVLSIGVPSFLVLEMIFYNIYATKVIQSLNKPYRAWLLQFFT